MILYIKEVDEMTENEMIEKFTINLPKATEKKLLARYEDMIQKAIEKSFQDKELYKPLYVWLV